MRADETAREILMARRGGVENLANALLAEESVDADAVRELLAAPGPRGAAPRRARDSARPRPRHGDDVARRACPL